MAEHQGYGQYCPIAVAAEIVAERWTPLVIRALVCGATRFNEIQDSVPRMSPSLLARRLRELEHARIVDRRPDRVGRGAEYRLTEAGAELFPMLEEMGFWAQRWLRREITQDRNLDPDVLMWEIRRNALNAGRRVERRRVALFRLLDQPSERRSYWLVFEGEAVDICTRDPGHEVDLRIAATMRVLVEIWLGHRGLSDARARGDLRLEGDRDEIGAFPGWFSLSHFAGAPRGSGQGPQLRADRRLSRKA